MFNAFVSTYAVAFCKTQGNDKTRTFGNEGFMSVYSFCVVLSSPVSFVKLLEDVAGMMSMNTHLKGVLDFRGVFDL